MNIRNFVVLSNRALCPSVYEMVLQGDTSAVQRPGQFVNIRVPELYLRRPISVCDWSDGTLTLVYKTVGEGTHRLSAMAEGTELNLLTGLGNGFTPEPAKRPVLIGGGVGVPPLYGLAKRLVAEGQHPVVVMGFNTATEVFYADRFRALGVELRLTTVDGSAGTKGLVTAVLPSDADYFYACGPLPMLRAVMETVPYGGQVSMEERMGCGFGACVGCTLQTVKGPKSVCKDGPVFRKEELL